MAMLLPLAFLAVAFIWNIYPLFLLLSEILFSDLKAEREKEWRMMASKLALTELRMIEEINITRQQMGMDLLPYKPVVAHMQGRIWGGLALQVRNFVQSSLANIFWKPVQ